MTSTSLGCGVWCVLQVIQRAECARLVLAILFGKLRTIYRPIKVKRTRAKEWYPYHGV